mmetsp:Transcript_24838/g.43718  ORF Transcript_24838/g.43718 Transcript_24838/m.43718 type:complete len:320 (+) Transcript_24838:1309-2268(+)
MGKPGFLDNGVWVEGVFHTRDADGNFVREETAYRKRITQDGSSGFPAVPGRYHLIVAQVCPWAHRSIIARRLKKLESDVSIAYVVLGAGEQGAAFDHGEGSEPDVLYGFKHLHQYYTKADPHFTGRVTVPVLWDKETETIVNNESAEIIEILNDAFPNEVNLHPEGLEEEAEELNKFIQENINNGVYRCGFSTSQAAYAAGYQALFNALDRVEGVLSSRRYLYGSKITLGDIRLYTTLVRFDIIYHNLFKCNKRLISSYPNLFGYLKDLYQTPGFGDSIDLQLAKQGYFSHLTMINPTGIIPLGPEEDMSSSHGREELA